jgi:putative tricarboxylic transport membrane protein
VNRDDVISGILLFFFGGITAVLSLRMPLGSFRMAGAGMFPFCLGILLMLLSSGFLLKLFLKGKKTAGRKGRATGLPGATQQLNLFFGAMVLATLFFNTLGYPVVAFLLMSALLRILGVKRWILNILISLVTAVGSYVLFVQWLQVPLPKGWPGL